MNCRHHTRSPQLAVWLVALGVALAAALPGQTPWKAGEGPHGVQTVDEAWHDDARAREVPVRIYLPVPRVGADAPASRGAESRSVSAAPTQPSPLSTPALVFSHGLGGSRTGYAWFGAHMASHGYVVVVPTHAGSDTRAMGGRLVDRVRGRAASRGQGAIIDSIDDPVSLRARPGDVTFVIDTMLGGKSGAIGGRVDPLRVGMAGHSFGAGTSMCIGGMTVDLGDNKATSFRDARVRAVLPMSPEGTGVMGIVDGAWASMAVPVLFLTGTRDYGAGERPAAWRRMAFDAAVGVDRWLVTLNDAGHMTFAGPTMFGQPRHDAEIKSVCTAFFDAHLNNDRAAGRWLADFAAAQHPTCAVEFRRAESRPAPR